MNAEHRRILKAKSLDIVEKIDIEDLKDLLIKYKVFNKYMWKDINSAYDLFDILPTRGPKAFYDIIKVLRETNYNQEANVLEMEALSVGLKYEYYYTLNSKPLGNCLIINNELVGADFREGSHDDALELENLFKKIGFDVFPEPNLKAEEMKKKIKDFSKSNINNVDSAILFIASHGTMDNNFDIISGNDKEGVYTNDIIKMFSHKNSEWRGKPKIFFFIACRGSGKDFGEKIASDDVGSLVSISAHNTDDKLYFADMLIVHSSLPGYVSMRDKDGAWFCKDFLYVLENFYNKCDLEEILRQVNARINQRIHKVYRCKQVCHTIRYGWTKSIMLCKPSEIIQSEK